MKNRKNVLSAIFLIILMLICVCISCISCKDKTADTVDEVTTEPETSIDNDIPDTAGSVDTSAGDSAANTSDMQTSTDNTGTASDTQKSTAAAQTTNNPTKTNQKYYSFLTGLECTQTEQRKRPVAIMIDNIKAAMPNVGVSNADIIYECIVEGGQTRLMMVLTDYENVSAIGAVRSSRDYYIDLSQGHDAIYVHAGGSIPAYNEFSNPARTIDHIDGVNPVKGMTFPNTYYRDAQRRKTMDLEHTLMTSGPGIVAGIKQTNYRTTLKSGYNGEFKFNAQIKDIGGTNNTANYVAVPYSNSFKPEFIYNPSDKLYYRKQFGVAHIDGATGEQLKFENVIVMFAEYTDLGMSKGELACNLTGEGYGFYISNGKYIIIKWKKATRDGVLNFVNLDGSDLYLNPGKSFICVTSKVYNKSVVITSDIKSVK
ncbi:MAG: DUF3048 domain-containing protein [Oscillospiraceae bacterium]|nr:DUF3048 domain-containing protein [Oscillospiraceae bacterium]